MSNKSMIQSWWALALQHTQLNVCILEEVVPIAGEECNSTVVID
jgi:hypothetical protein